MGKVVIIPQSVATEYMAALKKANLKYGVLDVVIVADEDYAEATKHLAKDLSVYDVEVSEESHLTKVFNTLNPGEE